MTAWYAIPDDCDYSYYQKFENNPYEETEEEKAQTRKFLYAFFIIFCIFIAWLVKYNP
jgi:hypothetical protein